MHDGSSRPALLTLALRLAWKHNQKRGFTLPSESPIVKRNAHVVCYSPGGAPRPVKTMVVPSGVWRWK